MAQTITSSTFTTTYKDDYTDSAGYYRILFNSGKALQARELTQLQTIIDKQIERIGNNLFIDGAAVQSGGQSTFNVEYIALQDLTNYPLPTDGDGALDKSAVVGVSFTGNTSLVTFTITDIAAGFTEGGVTYPAAVYVTYTNTSSNTGANTSAPRVQTGELFTDSISGRQFKVAPTGGVVDFIGFGNKFAIGASVHYAKGFFVYSAPQEIYVDKFSNSPTAEIGYKVTEDIVSVADDTSLYDNQGTTPNITAPGADRYRVRLVLTKKSDIIAGQTFIYLANISGGIISSEVDAFTQYKIPRDLIAKRIKENSGDYIVQPYITNFLTDSDASFLRLKHSPGTAVIDGYRVNTQSQGFIRVPKSTSTISRSDDLIAMTYGNYVEVTEANTSGMPDIAAFAELTLRTAATYGGSSIGTARVRAVTYDAASNFYRIYLFDISVNVGSDFGDVGSIGTSSSNYFDVRQVGGKAVLNDAFNNTLFAQLPRSRVASLSDVDVTVQRQITITHDGSADTVQANSTNGSLTGSETFTDADLWYYSYADSSINQITGTFSGGASLTDQVDLTVAAAHGSGTNVTVYGYVRDPAAAPRSKTLTDRSLTVGVLDTSNGSSYINLHRADIYSITEVVDHLDSTRNLAGNFTFDNGQRDNYYGLGRLVLKGGSTDPTISGPVHVKFKYYTHGNGKYFSKASYDNAGASITYNDIQNYTTADGVKFNLRDVLDFRSIADSNGNFSDAATGAKVNSIPRVNDTIEIGASSYFLPRKDKLIIDKTGLITYMQGQPGSGKSPVTPMGAMPLYEYSLNANTLNFKDLSIKKIDHKRYTMKDISRLENRIDKVEEFTTLSMLEIDAINFDVLDASGDNRLKSGILADNFSTHLLSDINSPNNQFKASIDWRKGELHPSVASRSIDLVYDSDNSINTVRKGDMILIDYDEEVYLNQSSVSTSTFINEFEVRSNIGNLVLSPSSDTFYDYRRSPRRIIPQGRILDTSTAYNWNHHEHNWFGTPLENLEVGDVSEKYDTTYSGFKTTKSYNKVVRNEIIEELIGERIIDRLTIPTMRSRKVFFNATGLRPNTQFFAFFNDVSVAAWVREETFVHHAEGVTDYSSGQYRANQHPDGISTLISDANGTIEGSFFIPSTTSIAFATGSAVFKLLDVSAANNGNAISQARATFTSSGEIVNSQEEWSSTQVIEIDGIADIVTTANTSGNNDVGGSFTGFDPISEVPSTTDDAYEHQQETQADLDWENDDANDGGNDGDEADDSESDAEDSDWD